jgi:hypothetical protein
LLHASHCLLWHAQTVTAPSEPADGATAGSAEDGTSQSAEPTAEPTAEPAAEPTAEPTAEQPVDRDVERALALVAEAGKKSALLWLAAEPGSRAYAAWHVWVDGAALVVSGGLEQDAPVLGTLGPDRRVLVTMRSKDTWGRLVTWVGRAETIDPDDDAWASAATELHAKRLNSPDGEAQPERWRRESVITRIVPTGVLLESPTHMPSGSRRAEPPSSPATTRGRLPFMVGRRARRRR